MKDANRMQQRLPSTYLLRIKTCVISINLVCVQVNMLIKIIQYCRKQIVQTERQKTLSTIHLRIPNPHRLLTYTDEIRWHRKYSAARESPSITCSKADRIWRLNREISVLMELTSGRKIKIFTTNTIVFRGLISRNGTQIFKSKIDFPNY